MAHVELSDLSLRVLDRARVEAEEMDEWLEPQERGSFVIFMSVHSATEPFAEEPIGHVITGPGGSFIVMTNDGREKSIMADLPSALGRVVHDHNRLEARRV